LNFKRYRNSAAGSMEHQDPIEEALCNEFAAALLMPDDEMKVRTKNERITPLLVLRLASRFDVSIHACARRLMSFNNPKQIGISYWQVFEDDWAVSVWSTGLTTRISGALKTIKASVAEVERNQRELCTYWSPTRCSKRGWITGLNIHVAPVPARHCLSILTRNAMLGFKSGHSQARSYAFEQLMLSFDQETKESIAKKPKTKRIPQSVIS